MRERLAFVLLCCAASLMLAAGCRTSSPSRAAGGRPVESEADFAKRAEAHAHYAQGVLDGLQDRNDEALEEFNQAAELDPGNEQLVVEVARRWLLQKKPERALAILKLGVAQPEATAMLDVLLGTAYAQTGNTNLATAANQRAIKKAPQLLAGYQNLYLNHVQSGNTAEAMKVLDEAAKQKQADADFLVGLAELYVNFAAAVPSIKTNAQPKALQLLQRAETLPMDNIHTRLRLADGFNVLGESDKAAKLYQALLNDYPQAPMLQENLRAKLTDIYLRGKDRKRAIEQLEVITHDDPLNAQAHYYLALLSAEAGDAARAEEHYRTVVVLNPKFEQAYYDLAMAQLNAGKTNDVFVTLQAAQKKFGENFVSEFLLGLAFVRIGKFDEAVRHYNSAEIIARATDAKRLTALFYFQMGSALERKGDYTEAVKNLGKALELKPDFYEAANYLGYMWAERGENLERAKELIDRAVKAEPKNGAYLDSLAWVLFKQGRSAEALPVMLQAVEFSEADKDIDPTLYDHLGDIYSAVGDLPNARSAWDKALKLGPNEDIRKKLERAPAP